MKSFLSSAPVLIMVLISATAVMLIEINLILPDLLTYPI
ncbi:MAG: Photosystem I reaction center subunit IX [Alkalinema sp. CAN_BIN05]|nr:Photosystem I reaction center subunit IX [Alkalinema sp. CAN_BIN05]